MKSTYGQGPDTSVTPARGIAQIEAYSCIPSIYERTRIADAEILCGLAFGYVRNPDMWTVFDSWLTHYIEELGDEVMFAITADCINFETGHISATKIKQQVRQFRRKNGKFSNGHS